MSPRRPPRHQFTSPEVALGAGLTLRHYHMLRERGSFPGTARAGGKGAVIAHGEIDLAAFALTGALYAAGLPLLAAGRIAGVFVEEITLIRGEFPSRLDSYCFVDPRAHPGGEQQPSLIEMFSAVVASGLYRPGAALPGDAILTIVDRKLVTWTDLDWIDQPYAAAAWRLSGWETEGELHLSSLALDIPLRREAEAKARTLELDAEVTQAVRNALGLLRVNASLAIRIALERICARRAALSRIKMTSSAPGSAEAASRDAAIPPMEPGAVTGAATRDPGGARGAAAHQAGLKKPVAAGTGAAHPFRGVKERSAPAHPISTPAPRRRRNPKKDRNE